MFWRISKSSDIDKWCFHETRNMMDHVKSDSLTHWGWVTHIYISKLSIFDSDNGLLPGRRQAIIWTNAGLLLIRPLGTNFSEILIEILTFSFKKMHLKVSSEKQWPFCLGHNVLTHMAPLSVVNLKEFAWINNCIHGLLGVITQPFHNFNSGIGKRRLNFSHGWVVTYHIFCRCN